MKKSSTYNLVMSSIMATFVTISTFLGVVVPIGGTNTTFHLGNITCLLAGIILGPIYGSLAAAVGSVIFDILNPIYITSIPFTFVFKFIMTFICGTIAYNNDRSGENQIYNIVGATVGSLVYIVLRTIKSFIINLYFIKIEPLAAMLLTLNGTFLSVIKSIFTVSAVAILLPIIREKLSERNLQ